MTRAAKTLFVTGERLIETDHFRAQPELTLVPGFMVKGCSHVPNGAWPGSLSPEYQINYDEVQSYVDAPAGEIGAHMSRAPEIH